MGKEQRGFASMDSNRQREIASQGGKAAHLKGTAHEWTAEEARDAGRKGGHRQRLIPVPTWHGRGDDRRSRLNERSGADRPGLGDVASTS